MTKTRFIIAISVVLALTAGAVAFAIFWTAPTPEDEKAKPIANPAAYQLTEADKADIETLAQSFVGTVGTFGWAPEVLDNSQNLHLASTTADQYSVYKNLRHTTDRDIAGNLSKLMGVNKFSGSLNDMIYSTPFSAVTEFDEAFRIGVTVSQIDGRPAVKSSTPITTTIKAVLKDYNYRDNDGNLITGDLRFETLVFKGTLELTYVLKPSGWMVQSFDQDTHVFATDKKWTFANGQFESSEAMPESFVSQIVNKDGSLQEPTDILQRFKDSVDSTFDHEATDDETSADASSEEGSNG